MNKVLFQVAGCCFKTVGQRPTTLTLQGFTLARPNFRKFASFSICTLFKWGKLCYTFAKGADLMQKHIFIPSLTIVGGTVGFFLRKWEQSTAFEADTGLAIPGMPATWALAVWSVALALALIILCSQERESLPYDVAFHAEGNMIYALDTLLSGFLLLASAGAEIITYPITYQTYQNAVAMAAVNSTPPPSPLSIVLPALRILLCILAFLCVISIVRNLYGARGKGKEHLPLLGPCALFCVWLISDYQLHSTDPVVQNYLYEILAICACLMGFYEIATYSFQTGHPRRTLIFSLTGVYFSFVTMADHHTMAELFRYGFTILFLSAHAVLLLSEHPAGEEEALAIPKTEA